MKTLPMVMLPGAKHYHWANKLPGAKGGSLYKKVIIATVYLLVMILLPSYTLFSFCCSVQHT